MIINRSRLFWNTADWQIKQAWREHMGQWETKLNTNNMWGSILQYRNYIFWMVCFIHKCSNILYPATATCSRIVYEITFKGHLRETGNVIFWYSPKPLFTSAAGDAAIYLINYKKSNTTLGPKFYCQLAPSMWMPFWGRTAISDRLPGSRFQCLQF